MLQQYVNKQVQVAMKGWKVYYTAKLLHVSNDGITVHLYKKHTNKYKVDEVNAIVYISASMGYTVTLHGECFWE